MHERWFKHAQHIYWIKHILDSVDLNMGYIDRFILHTKIHHVDHQEVIVHDANRKT